MRPPRMTLLVGVALLSASAAQVDPSSGIPASDAESALSQLPPGYLPRESLPDSMALLPPPPEERTAALLRDEEARQSVANLKGTPRWERASSDADLSLLHAADNFSCSAGVPLGPETTPRTYALLGKMFIDVGLSTYGAKNHYRRMRPFVVHAEPTCSPGDEAMLRTDGSYPSGHSAVGWGWALVLAELVPERADAIVQRGRDFGQSRLVCNVHWQSDIDAGRVIASATVARLHADATFRSDLEAARAELEAARKSQRQLASDCAAEAASLQMPG